MLVHVLREYNVNKILLSHVGLWPFQNKFVRNLLPISYFVIYISSFLLEILTLSNHWGNIKLIFRDFHHIIAIIIFIAKLFNEFWNYDKILCLYEAMENHWNIFTSEFEMRILKNYSILSRKCTIIYSIMVYFIIIIYISISLKPILLDIIWPLNESRPRVFILSIEWRVDKDKYFVPIFCYDMTLVVTGLIILISVDCIYITRIIHACSLFSIISQQFEKMMSKSDINMEVNKCENYMNVLFKLASEQVIYEKYVTCLKKYQLALEFVDLLNSLYRIMTLISLLITGAVISLTGIQLVYVLDQFEEVFKCIFTILGSLLHLMLLCYPGQKLLDESQNVFYQIYATEWYTFSPRLKSLLIITLHRSFIPCSLTAGNIFLLSMTTYATVVRAGISYFTTFLSLKD